MDNQKTASTIKEYITSLLIWALFFLPPLIFIPGKLNNKWIFVSYREPKLAAIQILSWLLITWSVATNFGQLKTFFLKKNGLTKTIFYLFCLFTLYSSLSASWALVPEAALYEASQWATLCCLYIVLLVLFSTSSKYRNVALYSILSSFAIVTIIGIIQNKIEIPFLLAATQLHANYSTFGAKNTCFVTLASQLFLLLYIIVQKTEQKRLLVAFSLLSLFFLELFYIFTSSSRTSFVAVSLGLIIFVTLLITVVRSKFYTKISITLGTTLLILFIVTSIIVLGNKGTNWVSNPGFELGNNDTLLPKDWILYPKTSKNPERKLGEWSSIISHSGKHSVAIYGNNNIKIGWRGKIIYFRNPFPRLLSIRGWSKAKDVQALDKNYTLLFKVSFTDKSHTWYRPKELNFSQGTHDWELKKITKYWPKNIVSIQPYCILYQGSGTAWFDDISIKHYNSIYAFSYKFLTTWKKRILPYLFNPRRFFYETARGAAILDTLDMFSDHPMGVGAGNWGFAYPLYHKHMIKKSFSEQIQIRRAHNDFIEILGELGLPGFLLIAAIIILLFIKTVSFYLNQTDIYKKLLASCLLCQLIVMSISMTLTFYLEYPYRKFLFIYIIIFILTNLENNETHFFKN